MTAHRIHTNAHPMRDNLPLLPMAQADAQFWSRRSHKPLPMKDWLHRKRPLWKRLFTRAASTKAQSTHSERLTNTGGPDETQLRSSLRNDRRQEFSHSASLSVSDALNSNTPDEAFRGKGYSDV